MCQLLETIKLENGKFFNLKYHNLRFNHARRELFGISEEIQLEQLITIPADYQTGLFRCRVVYSSNIERIEFIPYQPRKIESLKVITDNDINYHFKYLNRERLNQLFEKRDGCDEIIIVKNGLVTDCSIGNLIFYDGQKWWTPSTPLLNGTRRMQLLDESLIFEKEIQETDIFLFQKIGIINVFYGMENLPEIPVSSVKF